MLSLRDVERGAIGNGVGVGAESRRGSGATEGDRVRIEFGSLSLLEDVGRGAIGNGVGAGGGDKVGLRPCAAERGRDWIETGLPRALAFAVLDPKSKTTSYSRRFEDKALGAAGVGRAGRAGLWLRARGSRARMDAGRPLASKTPSGRDTHRSRLQRHRYAEGSLEAGVSSPSRAPSRRHDQVVANWI